MAKTVSVHQHNQSMQAALSGTSSLFKQLRASNIPVLEINIKNGTINIRTARPVTFAGAKPLSSIITPSTIKTRVLLHGCFLEWTENREVTA